MLVTVDGNFCPNSNGVVVTFDSDNGDRVTLGLNEGKQLAVVMLGQDDLPKHIEAVIPISKFVELMNIAFNEYKIQPVL